MKSITTHRFHELCGLSILGQPGETVYLTAAECRKVARALNACARSINAERFAYSRVPTTAVSLTDPRNNRS